MTTTSQFQIIPDYFNSQEECKNSRKSITNKRYPNFTQTHFTAGDENQFEKYRLAINGNICSRNISIGENIFNNILLQDNIPNIYRNLEADCVLNTFRYIFNKFKKGIFVKIMDNELKVFLPFSKNKFINEWSKNIQINPSYINNISDFLRNNDMYRNSPQNIKLLFAFLEHVQRLGGYKFNPGSVQSSTKHWYSNNCLVRYENPIHEGDSNVGAVKNMLEELCQNRTVPDIEFFINRRDFPILTKDQTEPYNHLWNSENTPLVSHKYEKYSPILSMSNIPDKYADIVIPTHEDWIRVQNCGTPRKWFEDCVNYKYNFDVPFNDKKPTAVFRGGTTGCGTTIDNNPRLKLAYLSWLWKKNLSEGEIPLLDAKITKWNIRPRKMMNNPYLQTIDKYSLEFYDNEDPKIHFLNPEQQSAQYKYVVNVEGHVSAFRLSLELNYGSVVLLVKSKWKIWYSDLLEEYVHYVPVEKDLSNLKEQIQWCRDNNDKCEQIVINAREFYNKYLGKNSILDYLQKTLFNLKDACGSYIYNYISPLDMQIKIQKQLLNSKYPRTSKNISDISLIPINKRKYGLLQGVNWIVNMILEQSSFEEVATLKGKITDNLSEYMLSNFSFIVKKTRDEQKMKEYVHEAFISSKQINHVIKNIPNFAYVFGYYEIDGASCLISEKIEGMTFQNYLLSNSFSVSEYLQMILQICLALQVAQNSCAFVHYELMPWNIVIQEKQNYEEITYNIGYNKNLTPNIVKIVSNKIPVIIDFGKSHIIHDTKHYGFVDMYNTKTDQDILTIVLKSVRIILEKNLNDPIVNEVCLHLVNFFANTNFIPDKFSLTNIDALKFFLQSSTTYDIFTSLELNSGKTPYDLFSYTTKIMEFMNKKRNLTFVSHPPQSICLMDYGNGRQIFHFILSKTDEERIQTYVDFFSNFSCSSLDTNNLFFTYYIAQTIEKNLSSVKQEMIEYLVSLNVRSESYEALADNTINNFTERYTDKIVEEHNNKENNKLIKYELPLSSRLEISFFTELIKSPYSEADFILPLKINSLIVDRIEDIIVNGVLETPRFQDYDFSEYKEIIQYIHKTSDRS